MGALSCCSESCLCNTFLYDERVVLASYTGCFFLVEGGVPLVEEGSSSGLGLLELASSRALLLLLHDDVGLLDALLQLVHELLIVGHDAVSGVLTTTGGPPAQALLIIAASCAVLPAVTFRLVLDDLPLIVVAISLNRSLRLELRCG